jgi:hypothetical protein
MTQIEMRLWRKYHFRSLWRSDLPLELKFSLSKGLFVGREAFVFAGGPSLRQVDMAALRDRLQGALVICIKQSAEVVGAECDAMIMNFCNFSSYDWETISCPVFWATFDPSHPDLIRSKGAGCHATFEVVENSTNNAAGFAQSTAGRECWEKFARFTDGKVRWGPGLMYELALPLALHAGVSHINLVGWDIGVLSTETSGGFLNEHFYDSGQVEIKTKITNLEIETVARSTKGLKTWLEGRGVGLSVMSDRSLVDASIKREMQWMRG